MIEIEIPGFKKLKLTHLVLDYNGTLAVDGQLVPGVKEKLITLANNITVHVITADTFGSVNVQLAGVPCNITILPAEDQAAGKLNYVKKLGLTTTVCIGNGRNDRLMLEAAALGLAVMLNEGVAREAFLAADVLLPGIIPALDLLTNPLRLKATLRS